MTKHARLAAAILAASWALTGCVRAPDPPTCWFVAIDLTHSTTVRIGPEWLPTVLHDMVPAAVLSRVRAGDYVFLAPLTGHAMEHHAQAYEMQVVDLNGIRPALAPICDELWSWRQLGPEVEGSNFGTCLRWIAALATEAVSAPRGRRPNVVACLFTDGYADGWQAPDGGDRLPPGTEVWIWGTAQRHDVGGEDQLDRLLAKAGAEPERVERVPFCDWQYRARNWRPGRPQDTALLADLTSGQAVPVAALGHAG